MNQAIEGYQFIQYLGNLHQRKFNRVALLQASSGEKYILKSCPLKNTHACEVLLNEFRFYFDFCPCLPQKSYLQKTEHELQLFVPYKKGVPLNIYWKQINKKQRSHFLKHFLSRSLRLLNEIHQKEIFHNDIKPSNFIVDNDEIHLIDFGMAVKKGDPYKKTLYSLTYSSPELLLNQSDLLTASSDFFSLGLMLIELISGSPIFAHENPAILSQMAISQVLDLQGVVPKELHTLLEKICFKPKFRTAPNQLPKEELRTAIQLSQETRKIDTDTLIEAFNSGMLQYQKRKKWSFFTPYQIA
jgi:serine/threonine protein kinase